MNFLQLKLVALIIMLIDHLGLVFFNNDMLLRGIGRLSFPIFAFMISNGYEKSKDRKKYFLRLFLFALASEVPYDLMIYGKVNTRVTQNVLFTFLLGGAGIFLFNKIKDNKFKVLNVIGIVALIILGDILKTSYGSFGVALIIAFYLVRNSKIKTSLALIILNGYYALTNSIPIQQIGSLALILIALYNGEKGYSKNYIKYIFYIFYPLHMLAIFIIKSIF